MGSVGANKENAIKGMIVKFPNGSTLTYRDNGKGNPVTAMNGYGVGTVETNNLSLQEIKDRAEKAGAQVQTFNQAEIEKYEKDYWEERKNRPDYELGVGVPGGNKANRKAARQGRLASRMRRR